MNPWIISVFYKLTICPSLRKCVELRTITFHLLHSVLFAVTVECFNYTYILEREVAQSCPTLCDSMGCSLPGSSDYGIFQARILEWVAISFCRGSSRPRDWTQVSSTAGRRFILWATSEAHTYILDPTLYYQYCLHHEYSFLFSYFPVIYLFPFTFLQDNFLLALLFRIIFLLLKGCVCSVSSVMYNSLQPYRQQPSRLLWPWGSLGKNTGVGCQTLLQKIFPSQGSNLCLLPVFCIGKWALYH